MKEEEIMGLVHSDEDPAPRKVKIGIYIDEGLLDELRVFIQRKYKRYYKGLLSAEIEAAISAWIKSAKTHQDENDINEEVFISRIDRVYSQIKKYLLEKHYIDLQPGSKVPYNHLKEAIEKIRGTHPSTVRRWLQVLDRHGYIRPVSPTTWELLE